MVEWSWVAEKLENARNYWLSTTYPDGRPHTVPSWGAWIAGRLYFGGGPNTRHARNLETNPHIVVHLESGDQVVILEGVAEKATDAPPDIVAQVTATYVAKYNMPEAPNYMVIPRKVFAWTTYPTTVTRFLFE
jgi:general stress protein 26